MIDLAEAIAGVAAETEFAGAVRVDRGGRVQLCAAYGLAHRGLRISNTVDTQFAIASGVKGLTALTIVTLIVDGTLDLRTTACSLLGDDLPLIDDAVTIEQLLSHRSGIGDYLDEDAEQPEYPMRVPVQQLATTEQYLAVLDGFPMQAAPGDQFKYCNGGYVVLALLAERAAGIPFHDLVADRVCRPAGMADTAFLRTDELPGRAAIGYVDATRSNVFHLPVRGSGDGGIYTTLEDVHSLWAALFAGRIVPLEWVEEIIPRSGRTESGSYGYGLGFWLPAEGGVQLEGADAGVSFRSEHRPSSGVTFTVISNTTDGAWPVAERLGELHA